MFRTHIHPFSRNMLTMYCASVRRTENANDGHVQYVGDLTLDMLAPRNTEYVDVEPSTWYCACPHGV